MTATTANATVPAVGRRRLASVKRSRRWALILSYVFLVLFAIFFLAPPYYMIVTSLKSNAEVAHMSTNPWWISNGVTFEHFWTLLEKTDFLIYFKNTAIVTVCVVVITMVVSVLAAYSLARMKFWGSGVLATGIFLTYLVPDSLLFIPLFQIVRGLGLLNSYWGMVLVYPTLTVPFCTWIMIGYFASIPKELDEAAMIDGANHLQMLTRIFIPVALPGIIAATIFTFTRPPRASTSEAQSDTAATSPANAARRTPAPNACGVCTATSSSRASVSTTCSSRTRFTVSLAAFVYPMAFLYSSDQQVLTVGTVTSLIRADVYQWGMLMAGALIAAAPPLVIYAFLMDYYIAGLTAGATKG